MANDPGTTRSVGKVGVDVVPDTSKFREELRAKLDKELAKVKAEVPIHADTKMARAEIEDFRRQMEARGIDIDVDVNIPESKLIAAELQKSLGSFKPPSFQIGIDTANIKQWKKEMEAISKMGGNLGVSARDADHVERSLAKLTKLGLGKVFNLSFLDKGLIALDRFAGVLGKGAQGFFNWTQSAHKTKDAVSGLAKVGKEGLEKVTQMLPGAIRGFIQLGKGIVQYGLKPLATVTKIAMKIALIGAAAGAALAGIAKLSALLIQMSGILIEAPAAFATIAAVVGVIALGIDGIKAAFASFPKAIAPLRKELSGIFQKTMTPGVKFLEQAINGMRSGLGSLAGSLGGLFTSFSQAFARPDNVMSMNIALKNMSGFFDKLKGAAQPFVHAITTLITVGTGGMGHFADTLVDLAKKFDAFITKAAETGKLQEWIHGAVEAFKTFGRGTLGVFKFLFQVFQGLKPAMGALTPLFSAFGSVIAKSLTPILSDLVVTLGPAFTEIINAIGAALDIARPGIQAFAKGFASFIRALAPAMPALGRLVSVLGEQLGRVLEQLGPVIAQIVTLFAGELADVLPVLIPPLIDVAKAFADILVALAPMIKPLAQIASVILKAFAHILEEIGPPLADFVTQLVTELAPYIPPLVDAFLDLFDAVQPLLKPLLDLTVKVFQALAPLLGPITDLMSALAVILAPIATVLAAIITALGWIIDHIASAIGGLVNFATDAYYGILGMATGTDQSLHRTFQKSAASQLAFLTQSQKAFVLMTDNAVAALLGIPSKSQKAWNDLKTQSDLTLNSIVTNAQDAAYNIAAAFLGLPLHSQKAWTDLGQSAQSTWNRIASGAASGTKKAKGSVTHMGDSTKAYLDGLDTYSSGQAVTNNFSDGILSAVWRATAAAAQVVNAVEAFFPHSPAKTGPFSGTGWTPYRGQALVEGFADGMTATAPAAAKAAELVMASVASPFEDGFNSVNGFIDSTASNLDTKFGDVGVKTQANIRGMVEDPKAFTSIGDQVEAALSDWTVAVNVDQRAMGRMAKKYDTNTKRRG